MDLDDLYRLLRTSHTQAQGVVDTVRDPLLVLDLDLTVVSANAAFYATFDTNRDDTVGVSFPDLGGGHWDIAELRFLLEQVITKSSAVSDYEVTAKFPVLGRRTMLLDARRIAQPNGGRRVLLLTLVDATERRQREESQEMLIGELQHRMGNLLAVMRGLARQTNTEDQTAEEYRDAFLGRFDAFSKIVHVTNGDDAPELPALARSVLEPYLAENGPVLLENGPTMSLSDPVALALGMILHELATNAVKYGALSVPDGRITIAWNFSGKDNEGPHLVLRWRESNGPNVSPPRSDGFGTRLIKFTAEQNLGGGVVHDYDPDGLVVTLTFPRQQSETETVHA